MSGAPSPIADGVIYRVSRWVRHQRPEFGLEDLYREHDAERLFAQSAAALAHSTS